MKEVRAGLETLRPGRTLFVREWILGVDETTSIEDVPKQVTLQMVLVHGTCATEQQFHLFLLSLEAQLQAFSSSSPKNKGMRCLLMDAVGCGQSPVIADYEAYSSNEMMHDLQVLVEKFADSSIPLVRLGHSYGPSLFLRLLEGTKNSSSSSSLSDFGQHFAPAAFIFMSTGIRSTTGTTAPDTFPYPDGGLPIFRYLPRCILQCLQGLLTHQFVQLAVHPTHKWLRQQIAQDSSKNSMFMVQSTHCQTVWATDEDLQNVVQASMDKHRATSFELPILVIHGVDDGVFPLSCGQALANIATSMASSTSSTLFVPVEQASHFVMMEQAHKVATTVLDFLVQHDFLK